MKPYFQDDMITLLHGDCRAILKTLEPESVQCCVTSPPYFGLRDYGTAEWSGGNESCDHQNPRSISKSTLSHEKADSLVVPFKGECGKCGAVRVDYQIGLEETPDAYVAEMVGVFREVWRVLKDDGTLWLNLGDSYASTPSGGDGIRSSGLQGSKDTQGEFRKSTSHKMIPIGLKPKDLIGIPWRVAFALQADGWYLRQDIIWHKPNAMPESVTDRCSKSHEYIFMLTKSARYYYDNEAIKEEGSGCSGGAAFGKVNKDGPGSRRISDEDNARIRGRDKQRGHSRRHAGFNDRWDAMERDEQISGMVNKRDVWSVSVAGYPGAHFATFPPALIEPCILAGSRKGDTVLDPFNGSGTCGAVARKHGRKYVGVDLNAEYLEMTHDRFAGPLFRLDMPLANVES